MKRIFLFSVLTATVFAMAQGAVITATPGSVENDLKKLSTSDTELEITGQIDVRDLRALASLNTVSKLNLSDARIVAYSTTEKDSHGQNYYKEGLIPQYTFFKSTLTNLTLPSGTVEIGAGAFANSSLKSVTIPSGVKIIGDHAFYGCYGLESISLPATVKQLGTYIFANSTSLKSVNLQNTQIAILPSNVLSGCKSLTTVTLPVSLRTIGSHAFEGTAIRVLDLSQVTTFEDYALAGMTDLIEVQFGNSATFGEGVLMDDNHLQTVGNMPTSLPNLFAANCKTFDLDPVMPNVEEVGDYALANTVATLVVLSPGLHTLNAGAMQNVSGLHEIDARALGTDIPQTDETAFDGLNTPQILLHVADYTENLWRRDPVWGRFKVYSGTSTIVESIADSPMSTIIYNNGHLSVESSQPILKIEVYTLGGALLHIAEPGEFLYETDLATDENVLIVRTTSRAGVETAKLIVR